MHLYMEMLGPLHELKRQTLISKLYLHFILMAQERML